MKRHPGRPPLDAKSATPSAAVHLKLPASVYDKVDKIARDKGQSVQEVIRRGLTRLLLDERG